MTDGGWTGHQSRIYSKMKKVVPLSNLGVDRGVNIFRKTGEKRRTRSGFKCKLG